MAVQLFLVWGEVPFWMTGLAVFSGLLGGIGFSRLLALNAVQPWTMRLRWLFLGGFWLMAVAALMVTMRIIFV